MLWLATCLMASFAVVPQVLRGEMPEQLWTSEVQARGAVCTHCLGTPLLLPEPQGLRVGLRQ